MLTYPSEGIMRRGRLVHIGRPAPSPQLLSPAGERSDYGPCAMKTVHRDRYGGPEVLSVVDAEPPMPGPGELLVRVHAATVNRTDCGGLRGAPFVYRFFVGFPRPRSRATGTDFAGEVIGLGEGVTNFAVGDRVMGFDDNGPGTHAEVITFRADKGVGIIPNGIGYEDAAASLEGAHYALNFINKVRIAPGTRVLVNGGTGAIGSAAIQLLKDKGAQVTAVCDTAHLEVVKGLGADRVLSYEREDFTQEDKRYDFVFDAVGKRTFGESKRVLEPRGIYISSELGPRGENLLFAAVTPLGRGRKVIFPVPVNVKATVAHVTRLMAEGKFKPLIDRRYPIEQIREAFEYVESGQKKGNVILSPAP